MRDPKKLITDQNEVLRKSLRVIFMEGSKRLLQDPQDHDQNSDQA